MKPILTRPKKVEDMAEAAQPAKVVKLLRSDASFLHFLDPAATQFTFQTFDDRGDRRDPRLAKSWHGTLEEARAKLRCLQAQGAGAFGTVNATDGAGRRTENITQVRALFVDLDGAPLQPLLDAPVPPQLIVESSPGRWHGYWRIGGCSLEDFGWVQKALAAKFNGDPSVHDLPRVMRLPGFVHQKDQPFRSRIVREHSDLDAEPLCFDEFVARMGLSRPAHDKPADQEQHNQPVPADAFPETDGNLERLTSALEFLTGQNGYGARAKWLDVLASLHSMNWTQGLAIAHVWSQYFAGGDYRGPEDVEHTWRSLATYGGDRRTVGSIFFEARQLGWRDTRQAEPEQDRRARSRQESARIGDGEAVPFPETWTLPDMLDRLVFVSDGARVVWRDDPKRTLALSDFRYTTAASRVGDGRNATPTANAWIEHPKRITTHTLTFHPGEPEFTRDPTGHDAFNLWRPRERPASGADISLFLEHLEYLIPEEAEREKFLNWLAHIVQNPGQLPHVHYLFVTPQTGIGRNWLASLMARVLPGEVRLAFDLIGALHSGFNARLSRATLVVVDELKASDTARYAGEGNYSQRLKALLTEEHRLVNPKYGAQHVEFNCARFLMFSQHFDALPLEPSDRRVIVLTNPTERRSPEHYAQLYATLDDPAFAVGVWHYLNARDLSRYNPFEPAPLTEAKAAAIAASMTEVQRALMSLREGTTDALMLSRDIADYLAENKIPVSGARALARAYAGVGMASCRNTIRLGSGKQRFRVVALRDPGRFRDLATAELQSIYEAQESSAPAGSATDADD